MYTSLQIKAYSTCRTTTRISLNSKLVAVGMSGRWGSRMFRLRPQCIRMLKSWEPESARLTLQGKILLQLRLVVRCLRLTYTILTIRKFSLRRIRYLLLGINAKGMVLVGIISNLIFSRLAHTIRKFLFGTSIKTVNKLLQSDKSEQTKFYKRSNGCTETQTLCALVAKANTSLYMTCDRTHRRHFFPKTLTTDKYTQ